MHCTTRTLLGAVLILAWGSLAHAQDPQDPKPGQDQKPAGEPAAPIDRFMPWTVSFSANEGYESDVQYAGEEGNGDWGTHLNASMGRNLLLRRGSVNMGGNVSQLLYRRATGLNNTAYGLALGLSYLQTRRLSWRLAENFSSSYSEDAAPLTDIGLLFPRTLTRVNSASADLTYQLSERSQITGSVTETTVNFRGAQFSDGSSLTVRVNYSRQISATQSLGASFGNTFSTGLTGDIQGLLATWQGRFGRSVTLNATGGIRPYKLDGVSGYQFSPGGSFGFNLRVARRQAATATYEYAVEQAYGFNATHLANRFNGNYSVAAGRRWTFDGSASYGLNTYPQLPGYKLDGRTVSVSARYLIGQNISVGGTYGLWIRHATGDPSAATYRVTGSLIYNLSFK